MKRNIKALVVDDSALMRKMMTEILSCDEEIEVVGVAANGAIALQKLEHLTPDIIMLDLQMPVLDGLATLSALREMERHTPVIIVSSFCERGAQVTLEALENGALDYVAKPEVNMKEDFGSLLRSKVKAICSPSPAKPTDYFVVGPEEIDGSNVSNEIQLTVIGASTGGPEALKTFLSALPADYPTPILVVQHMPEVFTRLLAERLNKRCALHVQEAEEGIVAQPGNVYIAPGDFHMTVSRSGERLLLDLNKDAPIHSCRPAVDPLFCSATEATKGNVLGVVLTGMGKDGLEGARRIKAAKGQVLCQDEGSSVVWGMPGVVSQAGLADRTLSLNELAPVVLRLFKESTGESL